MFSSCILIRKGIFYFSQQVNKNLLSYHRMSYIVLSKFIISLQVSMKHRGYFPGVTVNHNLQYWLNKDKTKGKKLTFPFKIFPFLWHSICFIKKSSIWVLMYCILNIIIHISEIGTNHTKLLEKDFYHPCVSLCTSN